MIIRPSSHCCFLRPRIPGIAPEVLRASWIDKKDGEIGTDSRGRMGRLYRKWRFTILKSVSNVYSCSMWDSTKIIYISHLVIYCVTCLCDFYFALSKHIKSTAAQHVPRCRDVWRFGAPRRGPIFAGWRVAKRKTCDGWCLILTKHGRGRFQGIMLFFYPFFVQLYLCKHVL